MILRELPPADPYLLYQRIRQEFSSSFLFESATGPERMADYTILGYEPAMIISCQAGRIAVDGHLEEEVDDPIKYLREIVQEHRVEGPDLKYIGGLVGYFSYDFARYLETLPSINPDRHDFPDFEFGLFLDGLIFHHTQRKLYYFSHGTDRFDRLPSHGSLFLEAGDCDLSGLQEEVSRDEFIQSVDRAREFIVAGDIFQVVLSQRLRGHFQGDLLRVYHRLRTLNPSPDMYYLEFGTRRILGSSPEMLVSVEGRQVVTYPIAGTRPIGRTLNETDQFRRELVASKKERAEHNMLVDLARNDIGRVAKVGTVEVPYHMQVERFSHVQHIVSRVVGELRPECDMFDAVRATFPAGTVTGAPKIRAMELIEELEGTRRGPYAGIVGYFSLNGNMDSAIAIRTLFSQDEEFSIQAGAGIVYDSKSEREWEETEQKLAILRRSLEMDDADPSAR